MDLITAGVSQIVTVARAAAAMPDAEFLCFGESDLPSPAAARGAMIAAVQDGHTLYPDVRGLPELRDALAAYLSRVHAQPVPEHRVQVTASGMAAISVALAALVRPGQRVVVHTPAWPNPASAARLRGADVLDVPLGPHGLDLDRLDAALRGARAFILNSPNNPTGWTADLPCLQAILDLCRRHGVWLIADEVYSRLVFDTRIAAPSLLDIATPEDRVIVCNSFSKTWAMTGWRLGWMVVPDGLRDLFADIVEVVHSGVAPFAQWGGLAALADEAFVADFRTHCAAGRQVVADALHGLPGVHFTLPDAAFYAWIGIDGLQDSQALALRLVHEHRVAVAPGIAFGSDGAGFLRVCFARDAARLRPAMQRLREGLQTALPA